MHRLCKVFIRLTSICSFLSSSHIGQLIHPDSLFCIFYGFSKLNICTIMHTLCKSRSLSSPSVPSSTNAWLGAYQPSPSKQEGFFVFRVSRHALIKTILHPPSQYLGILRIRLKIKALFKSYGIFLLLSRYQIFVHSFIIAHYSLLFRTPSFNLMTITSNTERTHHQSQEDEKKTVDLKWSRRPWQWHGRQRKSRSGKKFPKGFSLIPTILRNLGPGINYKKCE